MKEHLISGTYLTRKKKMIDWTEHGFENEEEVDEFLKELDEELTMDEEETLGSIVEELSK